MKNDYVLNWGMGSKNDSWNHYFSSNISHGQGSNHQVQKATYMNCRQCDMKERSCTVYLNISNWPKLEILAPMFPSYQIPCRHSYFINAYQCLWKHKRIQQHYHIALTILYSLLSMHQALPYKIFA